MLQCISSSLLSESQIAAEVGKAGSDAYAILHGSRREESLKNLQHFKYMDQ